jgi:hypothetical protein
MLNTRTAPSEREKGSHPSGGRMTPDADKKKRKQPSHHKEEQMRKPARIGILTVLVATLSSLVATTAATSGKLPELPKVPSAPSQPVAPNQVDAPKLRAGGTYQASLFPLALHISMPGGTWLGAQGRTLAKGISPTELGPFGWVEFYKPAPPNSAFGYIAMITAYGHTPSVAATVSGLRTRGHGATYQATSPAKLAGFSGIQFDGQINAENHHFIPFTPQSHAARFYPDIYTFEHGEVFRIIVLNVRGKTVVVLIDSAALPADQFPNYLTTEANQLLKTLRFPTS